MSDQLPNVTNSAPSPAPGEQSRRRRRILKMVVNLAVLGGRALLRVGKTCAKLFLGYQPAGQALRTKTISRQAQLGSMGFATLVVLVAVSSLLHWGYSSPHPSNPPTFWGLETIVVVLSLMAAGYEFVEMFTQTWLLQYDEPRPSWVTRVVVPRRHQWGGIVVVICVALNMLALWRIVDHTGGGIESPFAPGLTAPALFGAFVAQSRSGMLLLLAISAALVLSLDLTAPMQQVVEGESEPKKFAYAAVALGVLFVAGFISAGRIQRERKLAESENGDASEVTGESANIRRPSKNDPDLGGPGLALSGGSLDDAPGPTPPTDRGGAP